MCKRCGAIEGSSMHMHYDPSVFTELCDDCADEWIRLTFEEVVFKQWREVGYLIRAKEIGCSDFNVVSLLKDQDRLSFECYKFAKRWCKSGEEETALVGK